MARSAPPEEPGRPETEQAAARRAAAAAGGVIDEDRLRFMIDALIAERRGYVQRGLADRVSAVDAELARLGHTERPDPSKP